MPFGFSWVDSPRLAALSYPDGDDLRWLRENGIDIVMTLTEEPLPRQWVNEAGILAVHLPVRDMSAPSLDLLEAAVETISNAKESGMAVAVHCMAGIGRTGTVLAAYFVNEGLTAEDAIRKVRQLRRGRVRRTPAKEILTRAAVSRNLGYCSSIGNISRRHSSAAHRSRSKIMVRRTFLSLVAAGFAMFVTVALAAPPQGGPPQGEGQGKGGPKGEGQGQGGFKGMPPMGDGQGQGKGDGQGKGGPGGPGGMKGGQGKGGPGGMKGGQGKGGPGGMKGMPPMGEGQGKGGMKGLPPMGEGQGKGGPKGPPPMEQNN
jgi:atypical dual specificity phosphatase